MRGRILAVVLASLLLVGVSIGWAVSRRPAGVEVDPAVSLSGPGLLIRDTSTGRLAVIGSDGRRRQSAVPCSRVYAAAGQALCLHPDPASPGTFQLSVLAADLHPVRTFPINGVPTRARVSADGRVLAWTVFVSGDSYTSSGFSTRSGILDQGTDYLVDSLEDFTLAGKKPPVDANFWGVSFAADDNTFYATMATGSHFYLVQGDLAAETITVLEDHVECPSLSPDGTRVVYKLRLPDLTWQLWVLDLGSRHRTQLAEPGNVDDQGAWLDDDTIAYGKVDDRTGVPAIWSVPADGSGAPTEVADAAESPAVLTAAP